MAKMTIIEYSRSEWDREGFYIPSLKLLAFREDVSMERRKELLQKYC
ncbi:TPA: hypothetical protein ACGO7F_001938 [Streptococcus suis]|nr:hypothetical protein [Streptococcus suis]MCK3895782.1 hypothetical protein [Streptococcus suis]NQO66781.1 hypothetical protein [Streptococcus suis]HEM5303559.1 hypothetical protein [Streptococcus suis]HEM6253162.1 hypothetical protein [Streptococcus suis]